MLLEFCSGGELEYHFQAAGKFDEDSVRSYIGQIALGLEYMHSKYRVVHRDLKPEIVLLDERGYCAIIDFNMAIKCDDNLVIPNPNHYVVGTLPYIAPELLSGRDHSDKVDWWSLGIMAYEFSHGRRPYSLTRAEGDTDKKKMANSIKTTKLRDIFSTTCSADLKSLISGLLEQDPQKRFGADDLKKHSFFKDFDWDSLLNKTLKVPLIPDPNAVNFKPDANVEEVFGLSKPKENLNTPLSEDQQKSFDGWDWIAEDQELPEPDPERVKRYEKNKKKKHKKVASGGNANGSGSARGKRPMKTELKKSSDSKKSERSSQILDKEREKEDE